MAIEQAAVLGAGVMGAQIAAHFANAGVPVLLLDVVPEGTANRNALAEGAVQKMLKTEPAPFVAKRAARLVTCGNLEDDLGRLAEADWIVEAVVESLEIKRGLYKRVEKARKKGSIVSSNTSTIPLAKLVESLPARFAKDFLISHFFNPPRYMRLLEVVTGAATRADAVATVRAFADRRLGKGVVDCHDRPGFIANRIGIFWMQCGVVAAQDHGVTVEEADAVLSRPVGIPKTGLFGLLDLVGLDLHPKVDASMAALLAEDDPYHAWRRPWPLLERLIAEGYTGRKGKGGFYRLDRSGGKRVKEAIDLTSGDYAPVRKPALESLDAARHGGLKALVENPDRGGRFAWTVLSHTLAYVAALVPEVADDIVSVDRAMTLGYNWEHGPFALIDRLGAAYFAERLEAEGRAVPPLLRAAAEAGGFYRVEDGRLRYLTTAGGYAEVVRPEGVVLLEDVKRGAAPLANNASASLWDLGDGVVCLEIHTKMNSIDPDVLEMVGRAVALVAKCYKALVLYNEGSHFSAGVNLGLALFTANVGAWEQIEEMSQAGQKAFLAMKRAPFPVVAAPAGMALGGGCELMLHADAIQAHIESYVGLVEAGVGLVPAWGGCTAVLARYAADPKRPRGPMPPVAAAFETIGMAKVAKSAAEAQELGFLRAGDAITFNRDRLLADAKARALALVEGYRPPEPALLTLPGPSGKASLAFAVRDLKAKGLVTPHDEVVADALAGVLSGGPDADMTEPLSEEAVQALERRALMALFKTEASLARMQHMLDTGKPLRN
ncbi:MAG TPA: 3-hydroxyacyl-CoA dehydrogenase NAD-binding domain-containing protein [Kiloniellales bacterium]